MAQSREAEIEYFQSVTGWKNKQDIINFLDLYNWDIEFATNAYFSVPDGTLDKKPDPPTLHRMLSTERHSLSNGQLTPDENHSKSSQGLHNSFSQQQTTHNSNEIQNSSTKTSFLDDVDQFLVRNPERSRSMFIDIDQRRNNKEQIIQYIDSSVIGGNLIINTPWGSRRLVYADYTASGRALTFIEYYVLHNVLPYYANTHSENNACALQTTKFREGSRSMIKKYVNATDEDVLIFTGSGSTAAINKLADVLNLRDEKNRNQTVVFISTFEHHSNILPWKETNVEIIRIPNNAQGLLDQDYLKEQLGHYHKRKHIICTFNAASNVTGIQTDVDTISDLVHQYDGWVFWDYAAAAPYVSIDMNPSKTAYKDAVFISAHKFVGGPLTPGILIAKKKLFNNATPTQCGGGSVNYVTRAQIEYNKDIETREESGTPNIIGSIRAGLVFNLKQSVGCHFIEEREKELVKKFFQRFDNDKKLLVLGSSTAPRLAIFSFLVNVEHFNKYLHHNFLCTLLNDLFGIQVRSGCSCAGPYVLDLLGISDERAEMYTKFITEDEEKKDDSIPHNGLMKPGFTRFNLSYFASDEEVNYILDALEFIANDGWKFLALYSCDPKKAVWRLRDTIPDDTVSGYHSLQQITYENGTMEENFAIQRTNVSNTVLRLITAPSNDPIEQARSIANNIPKYVCENVDFRSDPPLNIPDEYKELIWFVTPRQVILKIINDYEQNQQFNRIPVPFRPRSNDQ